MFDIKVLVGEFSAVNRQAPSAVVVGEVAPLRHEVLNHSVEGAPLVSVLVRIVTRAQGPEILCSLGYIVCEKLQNHHQPNNQLTSNFKSPRGAPFMLTLKKTRGFFGSETPSPFALANLNLLNEASIDADCLRIKLCLSIWDSILINLF